MLTKQLPLPLALITLITGTTIQAHAAVIANLRGDYDTPSTAHTDDQTAAGRIPDTLGTGSWTFFARSTMAPGGSQTALVYDTSANIVRTANAYVLPGANLSLPAISNTKLIDGALETNPAGDELALHPGRQDLAQRFLVVRWTAGSNAVGTVDLTGAIRDFGSNADGVTFQIFNQDGTTLFSPVSTSGGQAPGSQTPVNFDFSTTVASGGYIDFVVSPGATYDGDHSALKITINHIPEPTSMVLGLVAAALLTGRRSRRA